MSGSRLEKYALPVIIASAVAYMCIYLRMTKDDTFIFMQFVSNMLQGHGMSFNAGEPTYGFTSVLWVAVLYLGGVVGGDLLLTAKAMSFVFALLSIVAFFYLARKVVSSTAYVYAATAAWAVNPIFINISFSGMESTLGTFLLIAGLLLHYRERDTRQVFLWAPAVFALAYLTRPEFLLLFPIWLADIWFGCDRQLRIRRLMSGTLLYVVPIGFWFGIAFINFNTIVPNPVVIKALQSRMDYETIYVLKRFFLMLGSIHAVDFIIILIAGLALFRWARTGQGERFWRLFKWPEAFLWLWVAGVLGSYLVQKVSVSPRYFLIVSPVLTLLAFRLLAFAGDGKPSQKAIWIRFALIAFILQSFVATWFIYYPHTTTYNRKDALLKDAALWMRQNTPPGTAVASIDIGILGYYSNRRVVDQTGLINPDIVYRTSALEYLHRKGVAYLLDRNPQEGYLKHRNKDKEWVNYEPVLFLSTPSAGWTAGLTEDDRIGFTLYRLLWEQP